MVRRDTSLPTKNALHRFCVALSLVGLLAVAAGGARLYAGEFNYASRSGLVSAPFLIALGFFFLAIAMFWRPTTRN